MDVSFYTAAVGAYQQQVRLDIHANNIANVNTFGFRARVPAFSSLMTGEVVSINEYHPRGVGAKVEDSEPLYRQMSLTETGRYLDFAIEGKGYFGVLDPATGNVTYTRDGSFILSREDEVVETENPEGEEGEEFVEPEVITRWFITDGSGRYVLGRDGRRIEVEIGPTTDMMAMDFPIGIFDYINYNGMRSVGGNQLVNVDKNMEVGLGSGKLVKGHLEQSNTDLAYEMSKVIESQRSFQALLRMVTTSDEITTTVNSLR